MCCFSLAGRWTLVLETQQAHLTFLPRASSRLFHGRRSDLALLIIASLRVPAVEIASRHASGSMNLFLSEAVHDELSIPRAHGLDNEIYAKGFISLFLRTNSVESHESSRFSHACGPKTKFRCLFPSFLLHCKPHCFLGTVV